MEETKTIQKPIFYSAPQLKSAYTSPAVAIGVAVLRGEQGSQAVRILIRRDLAVRLSSFKVRLRFSDLPLEQEDGENPFFEFVYDKADLNTREYLVVKLSNSSGKGKCTPFVSAVTFDGGKSVSYRMDDYKDAPDGISPMLRDYLNSLSQKGKNADAQKTESAIANTEQAGAASAPVQKERRKSRRSVFSSPGGILVLVLVVAALGAVAAAVFRPQSVVAPPDKSTETAEISRKEVSNLTAAKDFSEAYRLVSLYEDETELLQEVCAQAVKHYLSVRDFDRAYLYASASPESFVGEVFDSFVEYFVSLERYQTAYEFLKAHDGCEDALQTLCAAAVDRYIEDEDFETAYFYATEAPQSLEDTVFLVAEKCLVEEGTINPAALAILQKRDDAGELDALIAETVGSLEDFDTAYTMAVSIKDESIRAKTVLNVAIERMKTLADENDLTAAYDLYSDASRHWTEKQKTECLTRMISYSTMHKNTAGAIFFRNLNGEDTSVIAVPPEDLSVRANADAVYFLLSENQKRTYHAVPFDLYKEYCYIQNGALAGTDITDAVSVSVSEFQTLVLRQNGTVTALEKDGRNLVLEMPARNDIVQIAAGKRHAIFLHADGTVSGSGNNQWGQTDVGAWKNVVKVAVGADFTAGLFADGTLTACGSNLSGQCSVEKFTDVLDIAACDQSLVLLFRDGSVKVVGDTSLGLKRADYFNNVKRIRAAASCIVAETEKGSFVMAHGATNGDGTLVMRWSNVRWFAAGELCIGNVDTYGRVSIEGEGAPVKGG